MYMYTYKFLIDSLTQKEGTITNDSMTLYGKLEKSGEPFCRKVAVCDERVLFQKPLILE